ncbi:MAG TPA: hypothetical protein VE913_25055, partial [Longimicrobium sp.]|nr:hypothetical protein [Longimicrobium sp.]
APPDPRVDASLMAALGRIGPALEREPRVRAAAALLCRARRYAPGGSAVATHALHLLCNKLGFSLREEHDMFTALARLAPAGGGARPPRTA